MKVAISVGGRFHAFNLAHQLEKRGHLERLITSYPKFEVVKYGIPQEKVKSLVLKEVIQRSWGRLPIFIRRNANPQFFINELFDKMARRHLPKEMDIFTGFSSFSLHSLRAAKYRGAIAILERGSTHIEYQRDILKKEYEKLGLKPELAHPKIVEKELKEYEEADYISIPSLFVKKTFLEAGVPEKRLLHIPYGVDIKEFRQMPKTDNLFRVVFAGGMTIQKGVHYLLRVFSELKLPNSELLLMGGMSDEIKPFFKKYKGSFKYIGHIPQKELYKYYSQGSVFVLNSIQDGFAMVMIQAMACGLPVICTTNTGGEDIIRDGVDGFVIPIRDTEKLKEKLIYLYENPEICQRMGQSAKERVSSGFTWDDYGRKMISAYEKILAKKNLGGM